MSTLLPRSPGDLPASCPHAPDCKGGGVSLEACHRILAILGHDAATDVGPPAHPEVEAVIRRYRATPGGLVAMVLGRGWGRDLGHAPPIEDFVASEGLNPLLVAAVELAVARGSAVTYDIAPDLPRLRTCQIGFLLICSIALDHALLATLCPGMIYLSVETGIDATAEFRIEDRGPTVRTDALGSAWGDRRAEAEGFEISHLGLSIVKELVWALGGRMWMSDRQDPGNTLNFTMPTVPRAVAADDGSSIRLTPITHDPPRT